MKASEITLSFKSRVYLPQAPQITSSRDAYQVALANWGLGEIELRETFKTILLNRANKVKGLYEVSKGGVAGTVVDAKLVFAAALKTMSSSLILVHNHPSGSLQPSQADIQLTRKLRQAGQLLDLSVLDHLIITLDGYYSFADEGII